MASTVVGFTVRVPHYLCRPLSRGRAQAHSVSGQDRFSPLPAGRCRSGLGSGRVRQAPKVVVVAAQAPVRCLHRALRRSFSSAGEDLPSGDELGAGLSGSAAGRRADDI